MLGKVPVPHHLMQRLRWSAMRRSAARAAHQRSPRGRIQALAPASIAAASIGAVLLMSVVVWVTRRSPVDPCVSVQGSGAMSLHGPCAVDLPTMRVESVDTAQIRETNEGVRLLEGTALFSVLPVAKGHPPVRVWVGGATIEVLGTRFRVAHTNSGGSIQLIEGTIRFTFPNGDVSLMHAGETLSWGPQDRESSSVRGGHAASPSPGEAGSATPGKQGSATVPEATADRRRDDPPMESLQDEGEPASTSDVMRRFEALRREARYTETELLRQQLEPVSFELGNALQHQRAPVQRICDHWRWHLAHFPSGVYNGSIEDKMTQLSCDGRTGD